MHTNYPKENEKEPLLVHYWTNIGRVLPPWSVFLGMYNASPKVGIIRYSIGNRGGGGVGQGVLQA